MALVTNTVKGSSAQRLLLLVHGYAADEQDLGGLLPYLDPDGVFAAVMPRAPIAAPGTPGYMWYDMVGGDADVTGQFVTALEELDALVDEQCAVLGLARSEAIFAGFSQGGGLALALGLFAAPDGLPRVRPAGVLAMSPAAMTGPIDEGARAVPVLVQHGTDDPLIPVQRSRDLARDLRVRRPDRVPRVPDGAPGRARGPAGRAGVARRGDRGRLPTSPCPTTRSSWCRRSPPRSGSARCCAASFR